MTLWCSSTASRIASGVKRISIVSRMIMLTESNPPSAKRATTDSGNVRDRPNTIVATPNPVTVRSRLRPAFWMGPWCATANAVSNQPQAVS